MDPITHGLAGALLGKGYLAERKGPVAVFALTLGAVFPDVDEFLVAASRDPLAMVKYHRGITHSFVAMPVWAALLALGTVWAARRLRIAAPSWGALTLIYIAGIASHIVLDGMTSFGTRMWTPVSNARVAWDFLFIIDLVLTAILLIPQLAAVIYGRREGSGGRAGWTWLILTLAAMGAWFAAGAFGTPFHAWIIAAASAVMAVACFAPAMRGWGFGVKRAAWSRAGTYIAIAYLLCCGGAHHSALRRVRRFAAENHIEVLRLGAIPRPPSLLDWNGEIRTPNGVYESQFDLRHTAHLNNEGSAGGFVFLADSPRDAYVQRAMRLPGVRLYWQFARFPVIRSEAGQDGGHVVEFYETRFQTSRKEGPQPFTYEVIFGADGKIAETGWKRNGMLMGDMQKAGPPDEDER